MNLELRFISKPTNALNSKTAARKPSAAYQHPRPRSVPPAISTSAWILGNIGGRTWWPKIAGARVDGPRQRTGPNPCCIFARQVCGYRLSYLQVSPVSCCFIYLCCFISTPRLILMLLVLPNLSVTKTPEGLVVIHIAIFWEELQNPFPQGCCCPGLPWLNRPETSRGTQAETKVKPKPPMQLPTAQQHTIRVQVWFEQQTILRQLDNRNHKAQQWSTTAWPLFYL